MTFEQWIAETGKKPHSGQTSIFEIYEWANMFAESEVDRLLSCLPEYKKMDADSIARVKRLTGFTKEHP